MNENIPNHLKNMGKQCGRISKVQAWRTLLWWCQEVEVCWERSSLWLAQRTWAPCWHGWCRCQPSCSPTGMIRPPCWWLWGQNSKESNRIKICFDAVYDTTTSVRPNLLTFDLVVEGNCGIRDTLPFDTVENSARHREAHDAEDGLHARQQKQH